MGVSTLLPYTASLRTLGGLLEDECASLLTLCEIHGGFLLHYHHRGDPQAVTSRALPYADVLDLVDTAPSPPAQRHRPWRERLRLAGRRARAEPTRTPDPDHAHAPLVAQGYAVTLQALGHLLDRRAARAVVVAELDAVLQVEYTVERASARFEQGQRVVASCRYAQRYTAAQLDDAICTRAVQIGETVRRAGTHLQEHPADIRAYLEGAAALEEASELDEAARLYHHALAMVPALPVAHYHLARLAFRRADLRATRAHLQQAMTEDSADGRPFYLLARLHERCGEPLAAVQALEQALASDPDNPLYAFEFKRRSALTRASHSGAVARDGTGSGAPDSVARPGREEGTARLESARVDGDRVICVSDRPGGEPARDPIVPGAGMGHPCLRGGHEPVQAATRVAAAATPAAATPAAVTPAAVTPAAVTPAAVTPAVTRAAVTPAVTRAAVDAAGGLGPCSAHLDDRLLRDACAALPVLGLAAGNGWEQPAWPSLRVPHDSGAAAAALPLTALPLTDGGPGRSERVRSVVTLAGADERRTVERPRDGLGPGHEAGVPH